MGDTRIFSKRSGRPIFTGPARIATCVSKSARRRSQFLLAGGNLIVVTTSIQFEAVAIRIGGAYEMTDGQFQFVSRDKIFNVVNLGAVTGGMTPSGGGPGTTIGLIINNEPSPSTALILDERVE